MAATGRKKLRNEVHVVYLSAVGGWFVLCQKKSTHSTLTECAFHHTKSVAVKIGRDMAVGYKAELFVHNKDGRIAYRDSYGGDSPRRKG